MPETTTQRQSNGLLIFVLPILALCGLLAALAFLPWAWTNQAVVPAKPPSAAPSDAESVPAPAVALPVKAFEALPVTLKVKQRTTTPVPGTEGGLSLTVDDITRGQVMISLLDKDGTPLAGPVSAQQGQSISFQLKGGAYAARVAELANALVGDDFVTVVIDRLSSSEAGTAEVSTVEPELTGKPPAPPELSDKQKIERLIAAVAAQQDAKFIRNGTAYSAKEAADHLRVKMKNAGSRVKTVADFIEKVATKSSITGKEYLIELPDGRTITTLEFLRAELAKIERGADEVAE